MCVLGYGEDEQEKLFDKYKYEGDPFDCECDTEASKVCTPSVCGDEQVAPCIFFLCELQYFNDRNEDWDIVHRVGRADHS